MPFDQHGGIKSFDKKYYNLSDACKHIRWIVVNASMWPLDATGLSALQCHEYKLFLYSTIIYKVIDYSMQLWGVQLTNIPDILQVV